MIAYLRRISEDDVTRLDGMDAPRLAALLDRDDSLALSLEKDWHALDTLLVGIV
jgi:hypothetical protein